ncbi:lipopolysaccharide assembly protein LapA domain-containing protein [Pseudomonas sp. BNK-43-a]|uniref:lipopolysaccharide assembly protein LapA domain-containing protein n=1 Tax=unclassified Pseudomonas TaxID=196821 RepID=UPI0039BF1549
MRNLKRAFAAVFVLLLGLLVVLFVIENQQSVILGMFGWSAPEMPVAVPILGALLIGLALGPLLATYGWVLSRRKARSTAQRSLSAR